MVSCLSLALVFVLLVVRSRVLAYGTSGIILWALVFTRPDMLPIAMIPTGWALLIEPWRKIECLAVAFLTFMAASVCHGVGIRTWIAPGCSGYPGTCAVSSGHRHTTRTDLQRSASYRLAARSCVTLWRYSNFNR